MAAVIECGPQCPGTLSPLVVGASVGLLVGALEVGAAVGANVCPLDVGPRVGLLVRILHLTPTSSLCPQLCLVVFLLQLLKWLSVPLQATSSKWMLPLPPPTVPKLAAGPIPS